MAIVCAVISGVLGVMFSLGWQLTFGWSSSGFFLIYFLAGQISFVLLMLIGHAILLFKDQGAHKSSQLHASLN